VRKFLIPTVDHSVEIKVAIREVPVASLNNLNATVSEVSIEVSYGLFQCTPCIFHRKGFGNHPQAELLALQSSFAVGDRYFEEIRFRFVEETKVCTPRHVADDVDSGLPHLGGHRGYLSNFILKNGLKRTDRICKTLALDQRQ
jgi:hypothetical protein